MGLLVGISGVLIVLYTLYCGLGLWVAQHILATERGEEPMLDEDGLSIIDHLPPSHIEMMKHYYVGVKGIIWRAAFFCLLGAIVALMLQSNWAVFLFGAALGLDCLLFLTYEKREVFLAEISFAEKLFDFIQYGFLLAAFLLLAWRIYTAG